MNTKTLTARFAHQEEDPYASISTYCESLPICPICRDPIDWTHSLENCVEQADLHELDIALMSDPTDESGLRDYLESLNPYLPEELL